MDPFIGEIRSFGFNFQPRGWFFCDGRLLSIQNYSVLFAILGTTYGGNGTTNFALPNLQGRVPMHWGTGPGAFVTNLGETMGTTGVVLQSNQIPQHTHQAVIGVGIGAERTATPTSNSYIAGTIGTNVVFQAPPVTANAPFSPKAISTVGGGASHDNQQPYLAVNFCIAFEGIFPTRS